MKRKLIYIVPVVLLALFTGYWIYLQGQPLDTTRDYRQLWGATYQIIALYGAVIGLYISHKWGGHKSLIGKTVMAFSLGLFLQSFGQTYSSYYVYSYNVESPIYPGIGDIGFFGSVLAYIYGVTLLAKAGGLKTKLKKIQNQAWALLVPIIMLSFSYFFFLKGYEFDWSDKIRIFLDFGYPFGQALYVSIAVLALTLSRNILGGIMKRPILFLIFALIFQYFSDFFFLYQSYAGTWYVGNINDYLYCASYFVMTMALVYMGTIFNRVKES